LESSLVSIFWKPWAKSGDGCGREADLPEHRARRRARGDETPAARLRTRGAGRDGEATGAARPHWIRLLEPVFPQRCFLIVKISAPEDDERAIGKDKLEFAEVRWMEISSVLQRESANGTKPVKQIEFKGERLDLSSVRRWREKSLAGEAK